MLRPPTGYPGGELLPLGTLAAPSDAIVEWLGARYSRLTLNDIL